MPLFLRSPRARRLALVYSALLVFSVLAGVAGGGGVLVTFAALAADPELTQAEQGTPSHSHEP